MVQQGPWGLLNTRGCSLLARGFQFLPRARGGGRARGPRSSEEQPPLLNAVDDAAARLDARLEPLILRGHCGATVITTLRRAACSRQEQRLVCGARDPRWCTLPTGWQAGRLAHLPTGTGSPQTCAGTRARRCKGKQRTAGFVRRQACGPPACLHAALPRAEAFCSLQPVPRTSSACAASQTPPRRGSAHSPQPAHTAAVVAARRRCRRWRGRAG